MSSLQKYFLEFHDAIKLGNFDENQNLRDKRDVLVKDLRENIPTDVPEFENFDQGSYAMNTGTNPKDGNCDIDVGLVFDCTTIAYGDPVALKKIIRDALNRPNRSVRIRRSCVAVEYMKNDLVDYHVDLAIYVKRQWETCLNLAKGKEHSNDEVCFWEKSDPKGLIDNINNHFGDKDDRAQMRRCIRYLKRWRDNRLPSGKPVSVALTCAAYYWFSPTKDPFTGEYKDLNAMLSFANTVLAMFNNGSIPILLPVEPYHDLTSGMTTSQMQKLKERLEELRDTLREAANKDLEDEACKLLAKQFGDEFPIPEKKNTAKHVATAGFAPAGTSA
jgi:hypothetical protein